MLLEKQPFHFYASSIGRWQVSENIEQLIKTMKRDRLSFTLWKIPGDKRTGYQIRNYRPVVVGAVFLGSYQLIGDKGNRWQPYTLEWSAPDVALANGE